MYQTPAISGSVAICGGRVSLARLRPSAVLCPPFLPPHPTLFFPVVRTKNNPSSQSQEGRTQTGGGGCGGGGSGSRSGITTQKKPISGCGRKSRLFSPTVTCPHSDNLGPFLYTWGFSIFLENACLSSWTDFRSLSVGMLACLCGHVSLSPPCKAYAGMIRPIGRTREEELGGAKAFDLTCFFFFLGCFF